MIKEKKTENFTAYLVIILIIHMFRFTFFYIKSFYAKVLNNTIGQALSVWNIAFDNESEETWRAGAKRGIERMRKKIGETRKHDWKGSRVHERIAKRGGERRRGCRVRRVVEWGGRQGEQGEQGEPAIWPSEPSAAWQHFSTAPWNRSRLSRFAVSL